MTAAPSSRYRSHPGEMHEWSLPIPQLAGARACRICGQLYPGSPFSAAPELANRREQLALERVIVEPYRACPQFDTCSVNLCPFDPGIKLRTVDPGDRETNCHLSKRVRRGAFAELPAWAQARLPFGGLYEREWKRSEARRRLNAALTPEQREKQLERLRAHAFKPRTARVEPASTEGGMSDSSGATAAAKARANGGEA